MSRTIALWPLLLLTACSPKPQPAETGPAAAPPAAAGVANPASVYCIEQGGTVEMREGPGGTAGYCRLPDGRVVEEWELYRTTHPQP